MQERVIFHIDVNSAFLSWESLENLSNGGTVDYRDIPSVVGGDIVTRHGVVVSKSVHTKPYGIMSGEPVAHALKKCPNLTVIKPHHEAYSKYSKAFINILKQYSDTIEQFSIDEAFVDMTGSLLLFGPPLEAASKIRNQIREELGFTVNIGISSNKLLAKMASDFTKPDRTHTLWPHEIKEKMWPLPVNDLFFVGKNSALKLNTLGIRTIGDLARFDKDTLISIMKKHGEAMWNSANGIDDSPVVSEERDPKGYSNETTLPYDITDSSEALSILQDLTEKVAHRVRVDAIKVEQIGITIKFNDLRKSTHQCTLINATNITKEIYENVHKLFIEKWDGTPIRLLGVQVSKIASLESGRQISLFETVDYEKLEKLDSALDKINHRFGSGSVVRASSIEKKPKP